MRYLFAIVIVASFSFAACTSVGDNQPPLCSDVGCGETPIVCEGHNAPCLCPQPDGHKIECCRTPSCGAPDNETIAKDDI
jgi:hypothetical protein